MALHQGSINGRQLVGRREDMDFTRFGHHLEGIAELALQQTAGRFYRMGLEDNIVFGQAIKLGF